MIQKESRIRDVFSREKDKEDGGVGGMGGKWRKHSIREKCRKSKTESSSSAEERKQSARRTVFHQEASESGEFQCLSHAEPKLSVGKENSVSLLQKLL